MIQLTSKQFEKVIEVLKIQLIPNTLGGVISQIITAVNQVLEDYPEPTRRTWNDFR